MSKNRITLSEAGKLLAEEKPIKRFVDKVWNDDYYPTVYWSPRDHDIDLVKSAEAVGKSEFFGQITVNERVMVCRALGLLFAEEKELPHWAVEGGELLGTLFGGREVARTPTATAADGLMLAGSAALDANRHMPKLMIKGPDFGFASQLEFASFLGAAILASDSAETDPALRSPIADGTTISIEVEHGIKRITTVGADMQGDFRMSQHEVYASGAITPFGKHTLFAPIGDIYTAGTYHSAEPIILISCLQHLYATVPENRRQEIARQMLTEISAALQIEREKPIIRFGNYGEENPESYQAQLKSILSREAKPVNDVIGGVAGYSGDFIIYGKNDVLNFANFSRSLKNDFSELPVNIQLTVQEVVSFIAALIDQANQANGRTDPASLLELIFTYAKACGVDPNSITETRN